MVQSKLMPVLVKIFRLRMGYSWQGLNSKDFYHVIGYDMRRLVITGEKADRAYVVRWEDVELVKSEITLAQSRPDTALLSEIQMLRKSMTKLSAAIPRVKTARGTTSKPESHALFKI